MLDAFVLDHVVFADQGGSIRIGPDEIGNDEGDINLCIKKDQIKNIEVFRSIRKYCLRIITETGCYDILNVDESQLIPIKQRASEYFGINLINTELETLNTTEGNLVFSNNILTLHSEKPVFSIPKNAIEHIVELGNEFQFHLKDVEIVLSTTSNAINFEKKST
ncbi:structure-specific recognition protein 1, partial [Enterocytozoon bieneusi H348]